VALIVRTMRLCGTDTWTVRACGTDTWTLCARARVCARVYVCVSVGLILGHCVRGTDTVGIVCVCVCVCVYVGLILWTFCVYVGLIFEQRVYGAEPVDNVCVNTRDIA